MLEKINKKKSINNNKLRNISNFKISSKWLKMKI